MERRLIPFVWLGLMVMVGGCAMGPGREASRAKSPVEVRMARSFPTAGHMLMKVKGTGEEIYVHPDTVLTGWDIKEVRVLRTELFLPPTTPGRKPVVAPRRRRKAKRLVKPRPAPGFAVAVELTRPGARKLARAVTAFRKQHAAVPLPALAGEGQTYARALKGKSEIAIAQLAVLVHGEVLIALPIKGKTRRNLLLRGNFTQEQASRLAAALRTQPAVSPFRSIR